MRYRRSPRFALLKRRAAIRERAVVANQKFVRLACSPTGHKDRRMFVAVDIEHEQTSDSTNLWKLQWESLTIN